MEQDFKRIERMKSTSLNKVWNKFLSFRKQGINNILYTKELNKLFYGGGNSKTRYPSKEDLMYLFHCEDDDLNLTVEKRNFLRELNFRHGKDYYKFLYNLYKKSPEGRGVDLICETIWMYFNNQTPFVTSISFKDYGDNHSNFKNPFYLLDYCDDFSTNSTITQNYGIRTTAIIPPVKFLSGTNLDGIISVSNTELNLFDLFAKQEEVFLVYSDVNEKTQRTRVTIRDKNNLIVESKSESINTSEFYLESNRYFTHRVLGRTLYQLEIINNVHILHSFKLKKRTESCNFEIEANNAIRIADFLLDLEVVESGIDSKFRISSFHFQTSNLIDAINTNDGYYESCCYYYQLAPHPEKNKNEEIVYDYLSYAEDNLDSLNLIRNKSFSQLRQLLDMGYVHSSLIALFHNSETARLFYTTADANGRWLGRYGLGRLNCPYQATKYSNIRKIGLADFDEIISFDEWREKIMGDPDGPVNIQINNKNNVALLELAMNYFLSWTLISYEAHFPNVQNMDIGGDLKSFCKKLFDVEIRDNSPHFQELVESAKKQFTLFADPDFGNKIVRHDINDFYPITNIIYPFDSDIISKSDAKKSYYMKNIIYNTNLRKNQTIYIETYPFYGKCPPYSCVIKLCIREITNWEEYKSIGEGNWVEHFKYINIGFITSDEFRKYFQLSEQYVKKYNIEINKSEDEDDIAEAERYITVFEMSCVVPENTSRLDTDTEVTKCVYSAIKELDSIQFKIPINPNNDISYIEKVMFPVDNISETFFPNMG